MSETTPNPPTDPRDGFTPGPWQVEPLRGMRTDANPDWEIEVYYGSCFACMCKVIGGDSFKERHANARLIASAPTLLADNERLRKRVADLEEMLDEADDELWLTYPNGETNTPAANLRERIRAALALAGQKGNEHGT